MLFNFNLNQALFLALARRECEPLDRALDALPDIPERSQWVNFVRNHDELTLDKLVEDEREDVYRAFAPEDRMRIYGRGIRRRLPTMLGRDRAWIELAYSLLFTLPGTPAFLWGEEIGLGRTSSWRTDSLYERPCSGPTNRTAASPPRRATPSSRRFGGAAKTVTSGSTSRLSATTRTRS